LEDFSVLIATAQDKRHDLGTQGEVEMTPRQHEVLENALELLVSGGEKALTTANIARASNCSKESLYKWFGDRDGLLAAMMAFQGSKVGAAVGQETLASKDAFKAYLIKFAHELLSVLSGDISLALNRLAIGQASNPDSPLGPLLIENGRGVIETKGISFLNAAKDKSFLDFEDARTAYHVLYGLIVREIHVRLLLGERREQVTQNFELQAQTAIVHFYKLYGPEG
jgi:AcrR family transcriptional regulator